MNGKGKQNERVLTLLKETKIPFEKSMGASNNQTSASLFGRRIKQQKKAINILTK